MLTAVPEIGAVDVLAGGGADGALEQAAVIARAVTAAEPGNRRVIGTSVVSRAVTRR